MIFNSFLNLNLKPTQQTIIQTTQQPQSQPLTTTTTLTTNGPSKTPLNAQSPLPRTIKAPVTTTITTTLNNPNAFTLIRNNTTNNKPDTNQTPITTTTKYGKKI